MKAWSLLRPALLLALAALPVPAALDLDRQGGSLGGTLSLLLAGDKGETFLLLPSRTTGPTPLAWADPGDPRSLQVGLDLLFLATVGVLDSQGKASPGLALPPDPALHGALLHWQALTLPGSVRLVDDLSPRVATLLGTKEAFAALPGRLPCTVALPGSASLPGGRILLCGGVQGTLTGGTALKRSALLDPRTYTWSAGPDLGSERGAAVTVALADGRVLVAGGMDSQQAVLASCELFDPATNRWTPTGSMAQARVGHAGSLLPDGRVLVSGGVKSVTDPLQAVLGAHSSAEIFNPATGTWSGGGSMSAVRIGHTLTRTGSRLLAVGGLSFRLVIIIPVPEIAASADSFENGSWRAAGTVPGGRAGHSAIALSDGRVLVAGGLNAASVLDPATYYPLATAALYNPTSNSWTSLPAMQAARALPALHRLADGRVLVMGGAQGSFASPTAVDSVEVLAGGAFAWHPWKLKEKRAAPAVAGLPGGALVLAGGGGGATASSLDTAELLFP